MTDKQPNYDMLIIGGGINGCGIARDASGRGLRVGLFEMGDLAQATSSGSTKLFHGGLRYLEYYEFRLVREALIERERLLKAMPHISWPMRFVLPHHKGLRPAWLLRLGLFIYDHLGGRKILPATKTLKLDSDISGTPLKKNLKVGFEYSDCWIDDARLVMLNARDAKAHGAHIMTRTKVLKAERKGGLWVVKVKDSITHETRSYTSKTLVNCAGPWVADILEDKIALQSEHGIRLVRGSHIVTRKLFSHDRSYIFQQSDGRIIFAIPYEDDYTLIGTTDVDHTDPSIKPECSAQEQTYLLQAASEYFEDPLTHDDIVWTFSGVRPLYDDQASSATEATRDYVLKVDDIDGETPILNVFGGKITTYRRLSESSLKALEKYHPTLAQGEWTAESPLPGGEFLLSDIPKLKKQLASRYPFLSKKTRDRMFRTYGMDCFKILGSSSSKSDLGQSFGAGLYEIEVEWQLTHEWACTVEDVIWRRTKLGLRLNKEQIATLDSFIRDRIKTDGHPQYSRF